MRHHITKALCSLVDVSQATIVSKTDLESLTVSDFFSAAFQTSLATEAILFAAFGFLFAAYCQYSTLPPPPPPALPERPAIANKIARVCKILVGLIALNAVLALYSLIRMGLSGPEQITLGIGFSVTMIALAIISEVLAYRM